MRQKVALIIPIYHPDKKFNSLLRMLKKQSIEFDLYIIDSGSNFDNYQADLEGLTYQIKKTTPQKFDHGRTRREAAVVCRDYPFLIYMTQDAIPVDEAALINLLKPLLHDEKVGAAYGRQLPNKDADILSAHARLFNYPEHSQIKSLADAKKLGIKAAFLSDTFAVYRTQALQEIGNFPSRIIFGEDSYVAANLILSDWKIAYAADAKVFHSHNYTTSQEFKRYFDMGAFHAEQPWIRQAFGQAEGEGKKFILSELNYVIKNNIFLFPKLIIHDGMKFLGYRTGLLEKKLPVKIKRKISMNLNYWK